MIAQDRSDVALYGVHCTGRESSILDCTHDGVGVRRLSCDYTHPVGVDCPVGEHVWESQLATIILSQKAITHCIACVFLDCMLHVPI